MGQDVLVAGLIEVGLVEDANGQFCPDGIAFGISHLHTDLPSIAQFVTFFVGRSSNVQFLLRIDINQPLGDWTAFSVSQCQFYDTLRGEQFFRQPDCLPPPHRSLCAAARYAVQLGKNGEVVRLIVRGCYLDVDSGIIVPHQAERHAATPDFGERADSSIFEHNLICLPFAGCHCEASHSVVDAINAGDLFSVLQNHSGYFFRISVSVGGLECYDRCNAVNQVAAFREQAKTVLGSASEQSVICYGCLRYCFHLIDTVHHPYAARTESFGRVRCK